METAYSLSQSLTQEDSLETRWSTALNVSVVVSDVFEPFVSSGEQISLPTTARVGFSACGHPKLQTMM